MFIYSKKNYSGPLNYRYAVYMTTFREHVIVLVRL